MSNKGEAIGRALRGLTEIETLVRSLGRMPAGTAHHDRVVEARKVLSAVDAALKDLGKKGEHACEMQGCYELAKFRHSIDTFRGPETIQLCELHSATSKFPEAKPNA